MIKLLYTINATLEHCSTNEDGTRTNCYHSNGNLCGMFDEYLRPVKNNKQEVLAYERCNACKELTFNLPDIEEIIYNTPIKSVLF